MSLQSCWSIKGKRRPVEVDGRLGPEKEMIPLRVLQEKKRLTTYLMKSEEKAKDRLTKETNSEQKAEYQMSNTEEKK